MGFALLLLLSGCVCPSKEFSSDRPFEFQTDTFSYANELVWEYYFDAKGEWVHQRREPEPDYTHHCFVVARSARQFFQHARFDPAQPRADESTYRTLIRQVVSIDPARTLPLEERIAIPGYANLREFSAGEEALLKEECGGAWRSYFQRGHWRMIFPFSRSHQTAAANGFIASLKQNRPPIVHIVRFPQLTINHAILLFDARESEERIEFSAYDPNAPSMPATLTFDRATSTFSFPSNDYFPGGKVDVYEIYRNARY